MDYIFASHTQTTITVHPPGGTHAPGGPGPVPPPAHPAPPHPHPHPHPFPPPHIEHIGAVGHIVLWVAFGIFAAGFVLVGILSRRVERKARLFHLLGALVLGVGAVAHLAMASGHGWAMVPVGVRHVGKHAHEHGQMVIRQVFYMRYVEGIISTPLFLLILAFLAGLAPLEGVIVLFYGAAMDVLFLLAALTPSVRPEHQTSGWVLLAFAVVAFAGWVQGLLGPGLKASYHRPSKVRGMYVLLTGMILLASAVYGVMFVLAKLDIVGVDVDVVVNAVLDVGTKVGFTLFLLLVHVHGEDSTYTLPEWFVEHRRGRGEDGRGAYGAVGSSARD